jgi:hypothetical protein
MKERYLWGLRLQPSFDELLKASKKPLRIPVPDRSATWFALSNYRAYMLDMARRYRDYEHLQLDYDQSGAKLPRSVAMQEPAEEGDDPAWEDMMQATQRADEQDAYELAFDAMEAEHRRQAFQQRAEELAALHLPTMGHWYIGENHGDLQEAGVEHTAPITVPHVETRPLPAPVLLPNAGGQVGALRPFPTFQELNSGQPRSLRHPIVRVNPQDQGYERLRANALEGRGEWTSPYARPEW